MELLDATACELRDLVATGRVSPREVVAACLARIEERDAAVGAFLGVAAEEAMARAAQLESDLRQGVAAGALCGVPVAIKDNLAVRGWPLTCASRVLEGYQAAYSATAVGRLVAAGAIPIARTNMDEFGFGSSTEHSAFGKTHNPWRLDRIPGGSSGGSAAAVAAGMVPLALGSDTGGSVRQPASLCGVTGLKPTYGRVSRFGLVAFASSLDTIGPLARTAEDAALALAVMAGRDPLDATTVEAVPPGPSECLGEVRGCRIGLPGDYFGPDVDSGVAAAVRAAAGVLEDLGAELVEVDLPHAKDAIATYYLVATAEASSNLARFDGVRYGNRAEARTLREHYLETRGRFGPEAKRRILLGTFCLSEGYYDAYYRKAQQVRTLLRRDFERAFERVDAIVGPTTPFPPYPIGAADDDPLKLYLCDLMTCPANLAGIPALSVPCGFDAGGLPVGLQIQGPALGEATMLRLARAYQAATDWHARRPGAAAR